MKETVKLYAEKNQDQDVITPVTVKEKKKDAFVFDFSNLTQERNELTELELYLNEPVEIPKTEPLVYWRSNQNRFKTLAKMARDFLAIPAASVPIEQVFSQAGDLITKKRNRLGQQTIKEIMCLNSWFDSETVLA